MEEIKHVDNYMLFSAKRSNYMKIQRNAKIYHFNSIIKENEDDQRQLFKVVKVFADHLRHHHYLNMTPRKN